VNKRVVEVGREPDEAEFGTGFGLFTGALPYPDDYFAPFTAAASGMSSGSTAPAPTPPPTAPTNTVPPHGLNPPSPFVPPAPGDQPKPPSESGALGFDAHAVAGGRGIKVSRVQPGATAERAGLRNGDVIRAANGYITTEPANLKWVLKNAARDKHVKLTVLAASDGKEREIMIQTP
jgi:hypothetical protein